MTAEGDPNLEALPRWLLKKKTVWFAQQLLLGGVAGVAGLIVLFLTFWLTYGVMWFGWEGVSAVSEILFSRKLRLTHEVRLICGGVFLLLLFLQYFRTDPGYWGDYPKGDYLNAPGLAYRTGVAGSLAILLAHPGASANMIADILLSGPRLALGAFKLFSRALEVRRLDENGCGELLAFLYQRSTAVPYEELTQAGWVEWLPQMRAIEGVTFLQKGLMLSSDLRSELNDLQKG